MGVRGRGMPKIDIARAVNTALNKGMACDGDYPFRRIASDRAGRKARCAHIDGQPH